MNLVEQLNALSSARSSKKNKHYNLDAAWATWANKPVVIFEPLMKDKGLVSIRSLSEKTGRHPASVYYSLNKLMESGYVVREKTGNSAEAWRKKVWLYKWIKK